MGAILSSIYGGGGDVSDDEDGSPLIKIHSSESWQLHFNEMKETNKLMVLYFSASWCGPCRFIQPHIKALATQHTDVDFVKIDVDELKDVAKEFNVHAMPTFVLIKRGEEKERIVGAKKDELVKQIEKQKNL